MKLYNQYLVILITSILISGCATTKTFSWSPEYNKNTETKGAITESLQDESLVIVDLSSDDPPSLLVKIGNFGKGVLLSPGIFYCTKNGSRVEIYSKAEIEEYIKDKQSNSNLGTNIWTGILGAIHVATAALPGATQADIDAAGSAMEKREQRAMEEKLKNEDIASTDLEIFKSNPFPFNTIIGNGEIAGGVVALKTKLNDNDKITLVINVGADQHIIAYRVRLKK